MTVDFERAITILTKKWEEMTCGGKPLFVEITSYWQRGLSPIYTSYLSCYERGRHEVKNHPSRDEAAKWIAAQITTMIESEFYDQQAAQEEAEMQEVEA